nr:MAG TPA: hypothetical protein [Inoviridae sp.]
MNKNFRMLQYNKKRYCRSYLNRSKLQNQNFLKRKKMEKCFYTSTYL